MITVGAAVLCGLVLLVSALSKVRSRKDYADFVASVPAFGIPASWSGWYAAATLAAELVITGLLLAGVVLAGAGAGRWLAGTGLVLAVGLFGVLTVAVWRAVARRSGAVCRCFGPARTPLAHRHVVRNALLLLVAVLGLSAMDVADLATAALAASVGAVGAVLVVRFDDLAELFVGPPARGPASREPSRVADH
ncbi:MauE/DoxX family redox-associated membrane protein [Actinophytocola sp.]|uniref:MauE/DoxX family redox-associated membrane protein n=1 Tax=Actinophytocola sp. TaxID=1872138 RepID=UPI002ED2453D